MSKIYYQSKTDGRKSNVPAHYGIFPSMLKNTRDMRVSEANSLTCRKSMIFEHDRKCVAFVDKSLYLSAECF